MAFRHNMFRTECARRKLTLQIQSQTPRLLAYINKILCKSSHYNKIQDTKFYFKSVSEYLTN